MERSNSTSPLRDTRVIVTGGAGFIGSELSRQLVADGADVTIVDTLVNGRMSHVADLLGPRCRLERIDVRDEASLLPILRGADVVFHLACLGVRHSIHSPWENHDVNASGTLTLLRAAREGGIRRFVHVSSSEVYGTAQTVPMSESHPTFPSTVYGAAKLAGECYARAYWMTYGFATTIVRPFNTYGPRTHHEGDSGEVIPKFMLRCMAGKPMIVFGDGTQTRDFLFVEDTARGLIAAATCDAAVGQTINLGYGREITINELARQVASVVGTEPSIEQHEPRPGDTLRLLANTGLAARLLDFRPRVSLRDGLQRLRVWYSAEGVDPRDLLRDEHVLNWVAREAVSA